jgi:nucleoside-diphosphate-sugar epimerase
MRYIVTGGAGFIGSHLAERLSRMGKVIVIDNLSTGRKSNLQDIKVEFIKGDINDKSLLRSVLEQGDIIFHEAAIPSVVRSVEDPEATNHANIDGVLALLIAARDQKAGRVIFASSSSVYGDTEELPKKETMPPNPKSPYALSKLAGEFYMRIFWEVYGLETVSLRYFNVFGPRQDPSSEYSAVIPKFIRQMSKGEQPRIYGNGEQTRDFTYVDNVVQANILASKSDKAIGQVINVATSSRISLLLLIQNINKMLGKDIRPVFLDKRKGDVLHSQADIMKAKEMLGYMPDVGFSEGLKRTYESLR